MIAPLASLLNHGKSLTSPSQAGTVSAVAVEKLSQEQQSIRPGRIQLQGLETLRFQGQDRQLISARDAQQRAFTLVNTGPALSADALNGGLLSRTAANQVQLQTADGRSTHSLNLASRIVTLTLQEDTKPATPPARGYTATVSDGEQSFNISSQQPLSKGQSLRVMLDSNQQLQVLPNKAENALLSAQLEALKLSLPKQLSAQGMSELIRQLQVLNNTGDPLPLRTQQALQQLLQNLPSVNQMTASAPAMKQALQSSGLFSESLLKQQHPQLNADLKLNLLRLNQAATEQAVTPRLPTEQIANAIERLTTSQLKHFNEQANHQTQAFPLHLELPIKDLKGRSLVQLDIDQDAADKDLEPHLRRWLVKLQFDLEETGRFDARAAIQGNKVSVMFAAEQAQTQQLLQQNMAKLEQKLAQRDIQVTRLESFQAKLDKPTETLTNSPSLIDVRS